MSSLRLLSSFGLCSRVLRKLLETDFVYDEDVQSLTSEELSAASGLDMDDCVEVIRLVSSPVHVQSHTLLQLLDDEDKYIVTFCKGLDDVLGGGLPVGAVTEVIGPPGIGKTQLCLQVCIAAQLPARIGGVDGEVVYIDTEGSFFSERLKEIALHAVQHLSAVNLCKSEAFNFTADTILSRVHYYRCHSLFEVLATVNHLSALQEEKKRIKLIIVDSIAVPVQQDYLDSKMHRQLQCRIVQELASQTATFNFAVLLISHLAEDKGHVTIESPVLDVHAERSLTGSSGFDSNVPGKSVVRSLETWSHYLDIKIKFDWENGARVAELMKSPSGINVSTRFQVTAGGIRDLMENEMQIIDDETESTDSTYGERQESRKRKYENLT